MANFYIVMDRETAWGVGKTEEQAIQDATQRVPENYGTYKVFLDDMETLKWRLMRRRYEAELYATYRSEVQLNGVEFYLEPISLMEWDDKLVDLDGKALARLVWEQQGANYITNLSSPY